MEKMGKLIFITGGVRSGKSSYAVELAHQLSPDVVFLATASSDDEEMKQRIEYHQRNRPSHWITIEEQRDVAYQLRKINAPRQVIIVDCLTLLISNLLDSFSDEEILHQIKKITRYAEMFNLTTIVISNEVGWGIVPVYPLGRRFRDLSGQAGQILAHYAKEVYLMVSGIPLKIKPRSPHG